MSLLNDALRAAEQRQNRPEVAAAYSGLGQVPPRQHRWLIPGLLVLAALVAGLATYAVLIRTNASAPQTVEMPAPVLEETRSEPEPEPVPAEPVQARSVTPAVPPPATKTVAEAPPPKADIEQTPISPAEPVQESRPITIAAQPDTPRPVADEVQAPAQVPAVKQMRETPEAVDRRVSRELSRHLRAGDSRLAEQRLAALTSEQAAPASREVFARAMLLQDAPERALPWLTGDEVQAYPALRLLKARAHLALGRLDEALASLLQDIPPVRDDTEYRVTLATLLQQSGQEMEAARHWSALISVDDSRPAWWVGLAIALESGGEVGGAVKAYSQAAQLPGLSPSLAEYVRGRLTSLQAG